MRVSQNFYEIKGSENLSQSNIVLSAEEVSKHYSSFMREKKVAVDHVNLSISKGEKVCIVGESGSGKTTLAKILCGLINPTSGKVRFKGKSINELRGVERRFFRTQVQYIPQCPDLALDPTWYLYDSIAEPLRIHGLTSSKEDEFKKVSEVCERVGLSKDQLRRKPKSLSGGELQRAVIARAIILRPEIIVADEPTSMLDPSIQAKIIGMLLGLQSGSSISIIFITHDLEIAKLVSERIFVMFDGRIVESGSTYEILKNPLHPYTKSLLAGASPKFESHIYGPCRFFDECNMSLEICRRSPPPEVEVYNGRRVRCWRYG
ncbi:MAG: ABC transporter ATP-binding protein [Candidatus Methanomethylicaceae archaeon]